MNGINGINGGHAPNNSNANNSTSSMSASTPTHVPVDGDNALSAPAEGIYRSFEDLLTAVQGHAKRSGYGVVKLRASNYRDGKPTRYDLVCDRGGVKYSSTAKKRNPSTRKVDCPWRAKAVCEVQLGNQWRFAVQDSRHNHEARVPAAPPGQENTPIAQSIRSLINKVDRIGHDMVQGFGQLQQRMDILEKRFDAVVEQRIVPTSYADPQGARMSGIETGGRMDVGPMDNMDMGEPGTMLGTAVM